MKGKQMSFFREIGTDGYDSDANKSDKHKKVKTIYRDDKEMSLKEMQDAVGGSIQLAHDDGETQIICNEEGKLKGLPENEEATNMWWDMLDKKAKSLQIDLDTVTYDYLVGDVLVLTGKARMT